MAFESEKLLKDIEKYRKKVKSDEYTTTWRELLTQYNEGDMIIDPEYQRLFRWSLLQQTQFIESVLLNVPFPPIFLAETKDNQLEVIDGLQRLSTILKFFAPEISHKPHPVSSDVETLPENDLAIPTMLIDGPIIESLKGLTIKNIPKAIYRELRNSRVTIFLLQKESDPTTKYQVFKRLNQYGTRLSPQEIRNCTGRLISHDFPNKLKSFGLDSNIRSAMKLSQRETQSMGHEENVLRLLAATHSKVPLQHSVDDFLDEFMVQATDGTFDLTPQIEAKILDMFEFINKTFPNGSAFRYKKGGKPSGGFSPALYEIVATGVYLNWNSINSGETDLKKKHTHLLKYLTTSALVGSGSNTRKKFLGRLELAKQWVK